jgi:hypothetical protein
MSKPFKALGMALLAMVALAAVDPLWKRPKSAEAKYEEFGECRKSTECIKAARWEAIVEARKSIESSSNEPRMTFLGSSGDESTRGKKCYVSGGRTFSLFTRELLPTVENPINSQISLEVSVEIANSTNSFYEQTQLKDCLA